MKNKDMISIINDLIRGILDQIKISYYKETICGFALCTDDELRTLTYSVVTIEAIQRSSDPDLIFCPTDWPYTDSNQAFQHVEMMFSNSLDESGDLRSHVDSMFQILANALLNLRDVGVFDSSVFLTVLSTDPSPYLEKLEMDCIAKLNTEAIFQDYLKFLEKWKS